MKSWRHEYEELERRHEKMTRMFKMAVDRLAFHLNVAPEHCVKRSQFVTEPNQVLVKKWRKFFSEQAARGRHGYNG